MKSKCFALLTIAVLVLAVSLCSFAAETSDTASNDKRVNLKFKDVPVREALDVLFDGSRINVVVDSGVTGTVTADIKDVAFDKALTVILKSANLTLIKDQGIYRIGMQKEETVAAVDPVRIVDEGEIVTVDRETQLEKIPLGYADPYEVAAILGIQPVIPNPGRYNYPATPYGSNLGGQYPNPYGNNYPNPYGSINGSPYGSSGGRYGSDYYRRDRDYSRPYSGGYGYQEGRGYGRY